MNSLKNTNKMQPRRKKHRNQLNLLFACEVNVFIFMVFIYFCFLGFVNEHSFQIKRPFLDSFLGKKLLTDVFRHATSCNHNLKQQFLKIFSPDNCSI